MKGEDYVSQQQSKPMYALCHKHMKQYVLIETVHGEKIDGVIMDLDDDHVYLIIPKYNTFETRQWGYYGPGYGYPPYGYRPGGLGRLILPLTAIAALSLIPW
ncbi:hypothetical protein FPQ13_06910 [Allobacillus salarius]|uniref:Phosphatidylinositol kinase n=1 Tax=Allobacillus salarius TaxID=1955272 RepID=A0A556PM99_9BACI|nr:hypothetical protein FPQ13_06910 [Allobacillus salarius]